MFKNKIIFSFVLISLINPIICKSESIFTPNRLFFGIKQSINQFDSKITNKDRNFDTYDEDEQGSTLCFKTKSKHNDIFGAFDDSPCLDSNGYNTFFGPPSLHYATLEFVPNYIVWRIGYNISLTNRNIHFTIVDYPTKDEEVSGVLNTTNFMIPIFINAGDKKLGKDGSFSFRFGVGPSFNYVNEFYLKNDKGFTDNSGFFTGFSILLDITYLYLTIKIENTQYKIKTKGDGYFKDDLINIHSNDRSIGFYYYF